MQRLLAVDAVVDLQVALPVVEGVADEELEDLLARRRVDEEDHREDAVRTCRISRVPSARPPPYRASRSRPPWRQAAREREHAGEDQRARSAEDEQVRGDGVDASQRHRIDREEVELMALK